MGNRYLRFAPAILLCAASTPSLAQAIRTAADVSVSGGYSNNPFQLGSGEGSGTATIRIDPSVYFEDERGNTSINASVAITEFFNQYNTNEALGVLISNAFRVDERTQLASTSFLRTSTTPFQDSVADSFGELLEPDGIEDFNIDFFDPSTLGEGSRVTRLGTQWALTHSLDEISTIAFQTNFAASEFSGLGADMQEYGGQVSYSRSLSPTTEITTSAGLGLVNFSDAAADDGIIINPAVSISHRFSDQVTGAFGVGASIVDTQDRDRGTRVIPAVIAKLCRRAERTGLCALASQTAQPTALGSVNRFRSFGLNYDMRPTQDDNFSIGMRWSEIAQEDLPGQNPFSFGGRELLSVQSRYSRKIGDRLNAFVSPFISRIFSNGQDRDVNYGFSLGITLRLGNRS